LIHTVTIFFDDIRMMIGAANCNTVAMPRSHIVESDSVVLSSGDLIQSLSPERFYKYLGMLEADSLKHQEMKSLLTKEYKRRV